AKSAPHGAACRPRPGLPYGRGESILFPKEHVERDARHFSVREGDLAGNRVGEVELAYLGRVDCDVGLARSLAHDADHMIRSHSQMELAGGRCDKTHVGRSWYIGRMSTRQRETDNRGQREHFERAVHGELLAWAVIVVVTSRPEANP